MKTQVAIINLSGKKIQKAPVSELARKLFKHFSRHKVVLKSRLRARVRSEFDDLHIVFVTSSLSKKLNHRYRKKNRATDVLSFSPDVPRQGLGELVLCMPVLRRQALENGHSLMQEVKIMVIHGFLHLLGYDHEKSRKEELKMMALQDKLLKKWAR